tara:strand:+ start:156 stop:446 length:291 start_codon:yes stop_codon:yes gene_type:complete
MTTHQRQSLRTAIHKRSKHSRPLVRAMAQLESESKLSAHHANVAAETATVVTAAVVTAVTTLTTQSSRIQHLLRSQNSNMNRNKSVHISQRAYKLL